jgi:hypothetical protein
MMGKITKVRESSKRRRVSSYVEQVSGVNLIFAVFKNDLELETDEWVRIL